MVSKLNLITSSTGIIGDDDLGGTDIIVNQLTTNGSLSPGLNGSRDIFELQGNLVVPGTGSINIEIGGPNPGGNPGDHDQVNVMGSVDLSAIPSLVIDVVNFFSPTIDQQFVILNNDGGDTITGTFAGLPEGSTIMADGFAFEISYLGTDGTGNDVVLTNVPSDELFRDGFEAD